jgi:hypothetical protein
VLAKAVEHDADSTVAHLRSRSQGDAKSRWLADIAASSTTASEYSLVCRSLRMGFHSRLDRQDRSAPLPSQRTMAGSARQDSKVRQLARRAVAA